jgi:RNA polymerase sigma factor (sigma-70 family)
VDLMKLATQAKRGDREAFIRMLKHIENSLYLTAKSILRKEEDVADALQETILKAYKSIHSLRQPEFFKTWIFRILINECHTLLAKNSNNVSVADVPAPTALSDDYENVDLREAVNQLDDQQRIVVILYYFEDMPLRRVADTLGISESAVKMRLARARNTLLPNDLYNCCCRRTGCCPLPLRLRLSRYGGFD